MRFLSNLTFPKIIAFLLFGAILVSFAPKAVLGVSLDNIALHSAVSTHSGPAIPAGSYGIVHLRRAKEGQLLHLRGLAGAGYLILRTDKTGSCQETPVELVAGDFGGHQIGIRSTGPITLAIRSLSVANTLINGGDIQSDEIRVSDQNDNQDADIILLKGLRLSQGFIIDPGHSFMEDVFGARFRQVPCHPEPISQ